MFVALLLSVAVPASAAAFDHGMGLIVDHSAAATPRSAAAVRSATLAPASVDLTPWAVPVGDQGQVNSCAAWAADYTALGYWERRLGIAGGVLAPMYTYSQIVGGQNVGTTIASHLNIARQQGVDNQADYTQGNYDYTDTPTASERTNAANWKLTSYSELTVQTSSSSTVTQMSIESALAAGNPVVIGLPVYANFMTLGRTGSGFYAGPAGAYEGGHAVTALGYDATGLRVENSWGTFWGDSGYATLSWSFVNGYVDEAVSVGALQGSGPVTPGTAPANTALPRISGTASLGQTLSATSGTWSPAATAYTYQWQRSTDGVTWNSIPGATATTYVVAAGDLGARLRVSITALNSAGSGTASSAPVGPVVAAAPQNTARPAIYGVARQGETLYATSGSWMPAPTSYSYHWQRSTDGGATWQTISGAMTSHYTLASSDLGAIVRVSVTATNAVGSGTATSGGAGPIASGAPQNTVRPAITGSARTGQTLRASGGSWSPAASSYAYQWQRSTDGGNSYANIAQGSAYVVTSKDAGARLRVRVTATNPYGASAAISGTVLMATASTSSSPRLAIVHRHVAGRRLRFGVALAGAARSVQATALSAGRHVKLHHGAASGHEFTFSGNLSRGRWTIRVSLIPGSGSVALRYDFVVRVGVAG
jgi:Papain family cysteine protease